MIRSVAVVSLGAVIALSGSTSVPNRGSPSESETTAPTKIKAEAASTQGPQSTRSAGTATTTTTATSTTMIASSGKTTYKQADADITTPLLKVQSRASFLHMTDLHISKSRPFSLDNLREFCDGLFHDLISAGDVLFLALTGDFTDGMGDFLSFAQFGQQESDWAAYRAALSGCVKNGVPIFKIRGNHDAFGVESFTHISNTFFANIQEDLKRIPSKSGLETIAVHSQSGSFAVGHKLSKSRFVFLDAGRIIPSPHQYHGEFSENQSEWLSNFIQGPSNSQSESTYIFIHFPLGSVTPSSRARLLHAVEKSASRVTFLSGHIHSVIGSRGVQSIQSHDNVDELQLSDFKWSQVVRKIDVSSRLFVDIVSDRGKQRSSATLLIDPAMPQSSLSLVGVATPTGFFIDSVDACGTTSSPLRPDRQLGDMHFYSAPHEDVTCLEIISVSKLSGLRTKETVKLVDARLLPGTISRYIFGHFFETLQVVLLFEYILIVLVARALFLKLRSLPLAIYMVLSPLVPSTLSDNFYSRPWVLSNGVAGFDIETSEVFMDYETIRTGIMMMLYMLFALAVQWKQHPNRGPVGKLVWTILLTLLTLMDMRMMIARGGLKTLILSPHSWFILYMWYLWTAHKPRQNSSRLIV